ncbi:zinc finger protein 431-like isoform X2 [Xenopus laevis]|uniref:Zinc finger protein 431-like isoform X2 n=1 Tax=Xenopus laevis TaxID=8355 RepID=A0A8J1MVU2_XENLA|nr:zinc finger protein 431-like isoform X2 [Xenopus laevis]XP_041445434.1 zinc finger protein 431-like isoform X2 [Xenopus laevis]XP_041445435.1 zinc finger protein 431-like isoform X2 [Xenopus laevis]XP_041445436.1 zinc finger protein 431-like isoform X2 [Xenopus laevis]XP_041445437.1 zinc finger protein 431-like isoform X2 [Xenopus laevis]XP_041445438.1 zinc finger protein 431-like isoform X2 [Xenopus laevis]XP_041445439.1 zinc finger protein 431-like isoform X2 [Xenopus laevis]XP_04144544
MWNHSKGRAFFAEEFAKCCFLSYRDFQSQDEEETRQQPSSEDSFEPCIDKREELPTSVLTKAAQLYTEVLTKHIKEHHEEVWERPCPHPGGNKVFMIDQYLQRHVKLIHTEERNHICDQCRQAFKQQKHLSVHQSIQEQASVPTVNRDTAVGRKGQALHLYPSGDSTLFPWIHSSWLSCTLQPTGLISSGTANLGTLLFCSEAARPLRLASSLVFSPRATVSAPPSTRFIMYWG